MVIFTSKSKKKLIELTTPIRAIFLKMILKDSTDAEQNELPFNAIMMYAFFERNLITFSKHHRQHFTARKATLITLFVC
jgi:hypothetical protein